MRMRKVVRAVSTFLTQLCAALFKAVVASMLVGILVVSIMHYMGLPVPSAGEMLRGVSRLAHVLS
jgi:ABC-type multidrug transport system permease subunit